MLILASKSKSRQKLLSSAGIKFKTVPADINESLILKKHPDTMEASLILAEEKAKKVSAEYPESLIIGADQIMELEGKQFSKPSTLKEAEKHLKQMRGKTHLLVNGIVVVKNGLTLWKYTSVVKITFRNFSDEFLNYYLKSAGEDICHSVGAYYLEELGSQLVEKVDGDYFSVLGLPLLPLFEYLRSSGEIMT